MGKKQTEKKTNREKEKKTDRQNEKKTNRQTNQGQSVESDHRVFVAPP